MSFHIQKHSNHTVNTLRSTNEIHLYPIYLFHRIITNYYIIIYYIIIANVYE